jgi:hypothetical protein
VIQYRLQQMNPLVGIRLGHPKELALHFLDGILFHVGQDEEQLVGHRRQRTGVIRRVAAACAGLPINGSVLHIRHQRLLEMGQQRREFHFC